MTRRLLGPATIAVAAFLASGASAQTAQSAAAEQKSAPNSATASSDGSPFAADKAASTDILDRATAREDISQVATSAQTSTVSGNSVNGDSVTGDIAFSDNAFQNASGLTVINANSGNNVSMNASLNVNIVMAPGPASPQ